jgi:hypothetical protein
MFEMLNLKQNRFGHLGLKFIRICLPAGRQGICDLGFEEGRLLLPFVV